MPPLSAKAGRVSLGGRTIYLGSFNTEEEAALARRAAEEAKVRIDPRGRGPAYTEENASRLKEAAWQEVTMRRQLHSLVDSLPSDVVADMMAASCGAGSSYAVESAHYWHPSETGVSKSGDAGAAKEFPKASGEWKERADIDTPPSPPIRGEVVVEAGEVIEHSPLRACLARLAATLRSLLSLCRPFARVPPAASTSTAIVPYSPLRACAVQFSFVFVLLLPAAIVVSAFVLNEIGTFAHGSPPACTPGRLAASPPPSALPTWSSDLLLPAPAWIAHLSPPPAAPPPLHRPEVLPEVGHDMGQLFWYKLLSPPSPSLPPSPRPPPRPSPSPSSSPPPHSPSVPDADEHEFTQGVVVGALAVVGVVVAKVTITALFVGGRRLSVGELGIGDLTPPCSDAADVEPSYLTPSTVTRFMAGEIIGAAIVVLAAAVAALLLLKIFKFAVERCRVCRPPRDVPLLLRAPSAEPSDYDPFPQKQQGSGVTIEQGKGLLKEMV